MVLPNDVDLLNPPAELEKKRHKLKRLVQSPNSFFMDVKCQGCFNITTVFSHSQTVVVCGNCQTVLCQPTGGRAKLTEGCSFRRKATSGDSDAISSCPVGSLHFEMEPAKTENFHVRLNSTDQIYQDSMYDRKSIFWQVDDQPCPRAEVICPQPRRATRIPYFMHSLNRVNGKPKGLLPIHRVDCASEILDLLLSKDASEGDSDSSSQVGFFCGSPPARTNNPVVRDSEFGKQSPFLDSPKGISPSMKQAGRVERGSPTCGSSPKVRIEGFACSNSESQCIVPAFA
ncbi:unnamed protein product [Musa hybrid cultivar]